LVKQQVQAVAPSVSFGSETDELIDSQPAKIIEADLAQQNVDFKILMAVIMKDDKYLQFQPIPPLKNGRNTAKLFTIHSVRLSSKNK